MQEERAGFLYNVASWAKNVFSPDKRNESTVCSSNGTQQQAGHEITSVTPTANTVVPAEERLTFAEWKQRWLALNGSLPSAIETPSRLSAVSVESNLPRFGTTDWRTPGTQTFASPSASASASASTSAPASASYPRSPALQTPYRLSNTPRAIGEGRTRNIDKEAFMTPGSMTPGPMTPGSMTPGPMTPGSMTPASRISTHSVQSLHTTVRTASPPRRTATPVGGTAFSTLSQYARPNKRLRLGLTESDELSDVERPPKRRRAVTDGQRIAQLAPQHITATARKIMASMFPRSPLEELGRHTTRKRKNDGISFPVEGEESQLGIQPKRRRINSVSFPASSQMIQEELPTIDISLSLPNKVDQLLSKSLAEDLQETLAGGKVGFESFTPKVPVNGPAEGVESPPPKTKNLRLSEELIPSTKSNGTEKTEETIADTPKNDNSPISSTISLVNSGSPKRTESAPIADASTTTTTNTTATPTTAFSFPTSVVITPSITTTTFPSTPITSFSFSAPTTAITNTTSTSATSFSTLGVSDFSPTTEAQAVTKPSSFAAFTFPTPTSAQPSTIPASILSSISGEAVASKAASFDAAASPTTPESQEPESKNGEDEDSSFSSSDEDEKKQRHPGFTFKDPNTPTGSTATIAFTGFGGLSSDFGSTTTTKDTPETAPWSFDLDTNPFPTSTVSPTSSSAPFVFGSNTKAAPSPATAASSFTFGANSAPNFTFGANSNATSSSSTASYTFGANFASRSTFGAETTSVASSSAFSFDLGSPLPTFDLSSSWQPTTVPKDNDLQKADDNTDTADPFCLLPTGNKKQRR